MNPRLCSTCGQPSHPWGDCRTADIEAALAAAKRATNEPKGPT